MCLFMVESVCCMKQYESLTDISFYASHLCMLNRPLEQLHRVTHEVLVQGAIEGHHD